MKKKIGLVLRTKPGAGGAFQYSLAVLEALASLPESEFQVVICYLSDSWLEFLEGSSWLNIEIPHNFKEKSLNLLSRGLRNVLPMSWWRFLSPYVYPVAKTLVKQRCDLWIFPGPDFWAYQIPVNSIAVIFDLMHRYERHFPEVAEEYEIRERDYHSLCKWTNGVLVDSEVGKQQLMESYGITQDKVHVLPYIPPSYIYKTNDIENFDIKYGLPQKFIFYPAQFWEHKNHKGLLRAAATLKYKIPDLSLVFIGTKKNGYDSTLKLVEDLELKDNIRFCGYVPNSDIPEFYRRSRAMIMPTFFGPTNIPPLEAIALGTPAAVSDIYGMREQMGDSVLYFDPHSIEEITSAIEQLWNDDELCKELSSRGLDRSKQWNQSHFNQRLREIINLRIH
jgi:glycosyltransferase involved in cell wall biosynthesis